MLETINRLLEKTDNIDRSTYIWNTVSATVLAMQGPVIQAVVSRTNGKTDLGIISIAFSVATLMMYVGQYGLRRFQASDVNEKFSFEEYHGMRVFTCMIMLIASLLYCVYGQIFRGYSTTKFAVVFIVCMLKLIVAYSDVYHGNMQQKGRFDVAAKATTIRYSTELIVFCASLALTHNLLASAIICSVTSAALMIVLSMNAGSHYCKSIKPVFSETAIKGLLFEGFPLFVGMFLNTYVSNAPRYAIDAYLTDDVQAVFSCIFMPVFVVQIAAQFVFNPLITSYAHQWNKKTIDSYNAFLRRMYKMSGIVIGIAVIGLAAAALMGIPILSAIFKLDLSDYRKEFLIIMLGGGPLAFSVYFSTVIIIIRAQKSLMLCYGIVSIMAVILSGFFVKGFGITGASWMYLILMTTLALSLLVSICLKMRNERKTLSAERI